MNIAQLASTNGFPPAFVAEVQACYDQAERPFHNWEHIAFVLGELERWSKEIGLALGDNLALAALGHDLVVVPDQKDNERQSAEAFGLLLKKYGLERFIARTSILIAYTARVCAPPLYDMDASLLVDADLAILGQPLDEYVAYSVRIALEAIPTLGEKEFLLRRAAFLKKMLEQKTIYHTDFFRHLYENRARLNMQMELDSIQSG